MVSVSPHIRHLTKEKKRKKTLYILHIPTPYLHKLWQKHHFRLDVYNPPLNNTNSHAS